MEVLIRCWIFQDTRLMLMADVHPLVHVFQDWVQWFHLTSVVFDAPISFHLHRWHQSESHLRRANFQISPEYWSKHINIHIGGNINTCCPLSRNPCPWYCQKLSQTMNRALCVQSRLRWGYMYICMYIYFKGDKKTNESSMIVRWIYRVFRWIISVRVSGHSVSRCAMVTEL